MKLMPRYSFRTLLLVALLTGPLLAWSWGYVERVIEERREAERAAQAENARIKALEESWGGGLGP